MFFFSFLECVSFYFGAPALSITSFPFVEGVSSVKNNPTS